MRKVSDLAFQTVKLGVTTFPELSASMGRVIPLAAAMNTSQEELFGTMATLTGVTGNASEVSTQLASIYSAMLKPTELMTKAAKKNGFESAAQMAKSIGLRKTLIALNKSVDGNEGKLAKLLKRKEALVAALALLGGQSDVYAEKLKAMDGAAGATDDAFAKQTEGINKQGHSWDKTKQRMIVFSQRIGDKLIPVVGRLLDQLETWLKALEEIDDHTIDSWIAMGKWAAIIAVSTKGLSGLLGVVQDLKALKGMAAAINGVNTELAGTAGKANAAAGAMRGFKVAGVASAAAVGLAIGTMLKEVFLDPQQQRRYAAGAEDEATGTRAIGIAKVGTLEEQRAALVRSKARLKERKRTAGNVGYEEVAGGIMGAFGMIDESPGQRRAREEKELKKGISDLERSIKAGEFEEYLGGAGGYQTTSTRSAPGQTIDARMSINCARRQAAPRRWSSNATPEQPL
jgi:hypothetical protein